MGLLAACATISLDSLGIGVSLPGVPLPPVPLLATITGLAIGTRLGERYQPLAEGISGLVLIALAISCVANGGTFE